MELPKNYPKGTLFADNTSCRESDQRMDYYLMQEKWEFIGRFHQWFEAMESLRKYDN